LIELAKQCGCKNIIVVKPIIPYNITPIRDNTKLYELKNLNNLDLILNDI
jgi:hypothetical protein